MIAHAVFFYFFSIIAIVSAIMVTAARNTVHSVFFLILDFISISCLFIMIGAEFLGMIMLIVAQQKNQWFGSSKSSSHIPIGLLVSLIIFVELIIVVGGWKYKPDLLNSSTIIISETTSNTHSLGNVLYTEYIHLFQISGMILLVAMIGAIVLTFRERPGLKRQSYIRQISRERKDGVQVVDVPNKKGVKIDV